MINVHGNSSPFLVEIRGFEYNMTSVPIGSYGKYVMGSMGMMGVEGKEERPLAVAGKGSGGGDGCAVGKFAGAAPAKVGDTVSTPR